MVRFYCDRCSFKFPAKHDLNVGAYSIGSKSGDFWRMEGDRNADIEGASLICQKCFDEIMKCIRREK